MKKDPFLQSQENSEKKEIRNPISRTRPATEDKISSNTGQNMVANLFREACTFVQNNEKEIINPIVQINVGAKTIAVQGKGSNGMIVNTNFALYPSGRAISGSYFEKKAVKSEYLNDVVALRNENHLTQKEIAQMLGISQPLVSTLLKKAKDKDSSAEAEEDDEDT